MKFLGIDFGTKRIGIAISDELGTLAFPYDTFENNEKFFSRLEVLCKKEGVQQVIIGKSVDYKRNPNKIFSKALILQEDIKKKLQLPVHMHDETLSTQEAKRTQDKKSKIDASAAALILQGYLDKKRYERDTL